MGLRCFVLFNQSELRVLRSVEAFYRLRADAPSPPPPPTEPLRDGTINVLLAAVAKSDVCVRGRSRFLIDTKDSLMTLVFQKCLFRLEVLSCFFFFFLSFFEESLRRKTSRP